ncbi:MAG: ABC transporter substrate-binding protein [Candidatus Thorarchaeota archaeon]
MNKAATALVLVIGIVVGLGAGFVVFGGPRSTAIMESIQARGYILVGTNTPYPPFEIYNSTSQKFEGFEIELMERVAHQLGLTVQWRDMDFGALIGACRGGTVDVIIAALFLDPERTRQIPATMPYLSMDEVVVVKNASTLTISALSDLNGKVVGVQTGTVEDQELTEINDAGGTIDIRRYAAADLMFQDLDSGILDALYIDEPVFKVYSKVYSIKTIFAVEAPPVCAYVRPDGTDLLGAINLVLYKLLVNGTITSLIDKYFV